MKGKNQLKPAKGLENVNVKQVNLHKMNTKKKWTWRVGYRQVAGIKIERLALNFR